MDQNIEFEFSGIVCDNPQCGWKDYTVKFENLKSWLNVPCPICGENLLTEKDYNLAIQFETAVEHINSLSEEELIKRSDGIPFNLENIKKLKFLENAIGLDDLVEDDKYIFSVSMHDEIKIEEIHNVENNIKEPKLRWPIRWNIIEDPSSFGDEWDNWEHLEEYERYEYFKEMFTYFKKLENFYKKHKND